MTNSDKPEDGEDPQTTELAVSTRQNHNIVKAEANFDRRDNWLFPPMTRASAVDFYAVRTSNPIRIINENGVESIGTITIKPGAGRRSFNTFSYDVLCVLYKFWEEAGRPPKEELIPVSIYKIRKALNKPAGGKTHREILEEMFILRETLVIWENSFEIDKNGDQPSEGEYINSVSELKWAKTETSKGDVYGEFQFALSEQALINLNNNFSISVNLGAREKIPNQIARSYYSYVDNILCSKGANRVLENKASTIIETLQLDPQKYRFKTSKKRLVDLLVKHLDGAILSNTRLQINCSAVETADVSEWKLRIEVIKIGREPPSKRLPIVNEPSIQDHLFYEMCQAVGEVDKNMDLYRRYSQH